MPNTRSAEKQMRVAERRRLRNRSVKSAVKTFIRKAERGIADAVEDAQALVVQAQRSLDKAASKGILHPGNAARRKARLMKKLNQAVGAAAAAEPVTPTKAPRRSSSRAGAASSNTSSAGASTGRTASSTRSSRTGRSSTKA